MKKVLQLRGQVQFSRLCFKTSDIISMSDIIFSDLLSANTLQFFAKEMRAAVALPATKKKKTYSYQYAKNTRFCQ